MAIQTQDTFLSGGRGAPNAWSPASNSKNWTQQQGAATMSLVTNGTQRGQLTGSASPANFMTLDTKILADVDITCRSYKSIIGVKNAVIGRWISNNWLYRAAYISGTFSIEGLFNGVQTTLASVAFTENAATSYRIHFVIRGLGNTGANLFASIWADGGSEPGAFMLSATDATPTLQAPGVVGVSTKLTAAGDIAQFDQFVASDPAAPATAPPCYGVTRYVGSQSGAPNPIAAQLFTDIAAWGNGSWIRPQVLWNAIEPLQFSPPVYNFAMLDDLVYRANQAGVRVLLPIAGAPSWYLTIRASDGATVAAGTGDLPDPTAFAAFAQAVAQRYNGQGTYGKIECVQVLNEECDSPYTGVPNTQPGRDILGNRAALYVQAAVPAIRSVYPGVRILGPTLRKTPNLALSHYAGWFNNFATFGVSPTVKSALLLIDAFSLHYYRDSNFSSDPTQSNVDTPSIALAVNAIKNLAAGYGVLGLQVDIDEFGWNWFDDGSGTTTVNPPNTIAQYYQALYDAGIAAGATHFLLFTEDPTALITIGAIPNSTSPKSIFQQFPNGANPAIQLYNPAYYVTKMYAQNPLTAFAVQPGYKQMTLKSDVMKLALSSSAMRLNLKEVT